MPSKTQQLERDLVERLRARHGPNAPAAKAEAKAASVTHGLGRILGGSALLLLSFGMAIGILLVGDKFGAVVQVGFLLFAAFPGLFGLWFIVRGSVNTSGEALDELKAVGGMAGMIAKLIRGKKNGT